MRERLIIFAACIGMLVVFNNSFAQYGSPSINTTSSGACLNTEVVFYVIGGNVTNSSSWSATGSASLNVISTSGGYYNQCRITWSSSGDYMVYVSTDNGSATPLNFTVYGGAPTISISSGSSTSICSGASVTFSASTSNTGSYPSFQWKINGSPVAGANQYVYTTTGLNNGDVVTCTVTSVCGVSNTSSGITMQVSPTTVLPQYDIIVSSNNVPAAYSPPFLCPGVSAAFRSSAPSGNSAYTVTWLMNGANITPGGNVNIITNGANVLSFQSWDQPHGTVISARVNYSGTGCVSNNPSTTSVTTYSSLSGVTISPSTLQRCQSSGQTQFTTSAQITDYSWTVTGGASISNSGLASWSPSYNGTAYVYLMAANCTSVHTTVPVIIDQAAATPLNSNNTICNFEMIQISPDRPNGETFNWYDNTDNYLQQSTSYSKAPSLISGLQLKVEAVGTNGCKSISKGIAQVTITDDCDDKLNWIETLSYDDVGLVGNSRAYFDGAGKPLQSQSKNFGPDSSVKMIVSNSSLKDKYGREAVTLMPVPVDQTEFKYKFGIVTDGGGDIFDFNDFEGSNITLGKTTPGTVGWYYSENNTLEQNVAKSEFAYGRKVYYPDGTSGVMQSGSPGNVLRIGGQHEALTGSFPVSNELDFYLLLRKAVVTTSTLPTLAGNSVQTVVKDENGKYAVSVADKAGKTLMTARMGTSQDSVIKIINHVTASSNSSATNFRQQIYFYILEAQAISITSTNSQTNAVYVVENLVTGGALPVPLQGNLAAGFYRVLLSAGDISFSYTNYFLDVSCQFYNDAGRLIGSVSPNGFASIRKSSRDSGIRPDQNTHLHDYYTLADKTTYSYNHRGWLLDMTEPDAGTTRYMYRKDGSIRYSQNAKQLALSVSSSNKHRFSYTNYDDLGRPVESGEYTGSDYLLDISHPTIDKVDALKNSLEVSNQVNFTSTQDWVKTHYDIPDPNFAATTSLTTTAFPQNYVRNAVSWTENANMITWYSYDERGRVTWMAQKPKALTRVFVVQYTYDFIGNVIKVKQSSYLNGGHLDVNGSNTDFYHHYEYDANKRLSKAYTSFDGGDNNRTLHATYKYYLHGPLKRIELGGKLQGIDFVYNINGWLESINHPDATKDPGQDGQGSSTFRKDVFSLLLDYYDSEFLNLFPTVGLNMKSRDRFHHLPGGLMNDPEYASAIKYPHMPSSFFEQPAEDLYFKSFSAESITYKELIGRLKQSATQQN